INTGGARGILMDLDFSSRGPDPGQDENLVRYIRDAGTVVLAAQMDERITGEGVLLRNVTVPFGPLSEAAYALGSITFEVDPDGAVRRMPPSIDFVDEQYMPLGVVGASMVDPDASMSFPDGALINFRSLVDPRFSVTPFRKILKGEYPENLFKDRIVLLGATSPDLHDLWLTPHGVTPGVFIQVAVLDTVLNRSWYQRQSQLSTIFVIALLSLFTGVVMRERSWKSGAMVMVFLVFLVAAAAGLASYSGYFLQTVPLILVCLVVYPVQVGVRAGRIDRDLASERQKTKAVLSIADLRMAEEEGQESQFVPLVLLGKNLDLSLLQIFTWSDPPDSGIRNRVIIGECEKHPDPQLLDEVHSKGVCVTEKRKVGGTVILVPLMTVRHNKGVLYAESRRNIDADSEDVRLLLAFATQTAYFLESLDLDLRIKELYINTIRAISRALDSKDQYTSAHAELSLDHVENFGRLCGLDREQIESLHVGALLHDIGKIGIPDRILSKEDDLNEEEYRIIRNHPGIGSDIVRGLPFPEDVKMIILHHHEHYDGTGYPDGLKGYDIPLLVRIFSILDVYEALIGYRPYRKSLDKKGAARLLMDGSGTQFDPHLLDIFLNRILFPGDEKPI
ncbi:MAG: CHASE2 domain-containing protein, partial [Pseudomonadota bacterium]